tara:strand:- start:4094 stop:4219 length:126 start_codon:yes stop_codon:yes gene_type:complete
MEVEQMNLMPKILEQRKIELRKFFQPLEELKSKYQGNYQIA